MLCDIFFIYICVIYINILFLTSEHISLSKILYVSFEILFKTDNIYKNDKNGGDDKMSKKIKNPYFWLSTFALIFSASGVDFNQLTSWHLLLEALVDIVANPVAIVAVITAFLGIWNDNSTKGLDKPYIKK